MRWVGGALHLAALLILIRTEGPAFGALSWACLLSVSAMGIVLLLALRPWSSAEP